MTSIYHILNLVYAKNARCGKPDSKRMRVNCSAKHEFRQLAEASIWQSMLHSVIMKSHLAADG